MEPGEVLEEPASGRSTQPERVGGGPVRSRLRVGSAGSLASASPRAPASPGGVTSPPFLRAGAASAWT